MRRVIQAMTVFGVAVLAGCQAGAGGGGGTKVATELAANLDDYHVESIAVLAFANTTGIPEADEMGIYLVQALYGKDVYHFIPSDDFARDAARVGMEADHARLVSVWRKKRTIDEPVVSRLLEATGYDALIAAEVSKWEEVKLQPDQEGTSDTSVGAAVKLYGNDGTLLWSASDMKVEHSRPYLPDFNTRATTSGRSVTTSAGSVPDPPEIEQVARKVAQSLADEMPVIKNGADASS